MPTDSRPITSSHEGEAKQGFFKMMNEWFIQYIRTNPAAPQPSPPYNLPQVPVMPQTVNLIQLSKPLVDKIRKNGVEEFRATTDDDAERAEFWIENTIRMFDEMSCTPDECLKCDVSLLRDTAYHWYKTLISVAPKERVTWEFF